MKAINWRDILWLMFIRDWPWKVLSLGIACMIYFSIRAQISHHRTLSVPVDVVFEAAGTGVVIESVEPRNVQVTLRGSYSALNQLNPEIMQFDISPRRRKNNTAPADTETVKLRPFLLRNANRLRVMDIEPSAVQVRFDVPMNLQLRVAKPELSGTARGLVKLTYEQATATVTGSRRLLASVAPDKVQVLSAPIDVEGRTQSFQTRVALYPPGDQTRLKVTPTEMLVTVQISSEHTTTRITQVPVQVMPSAAGNAQWLCVPQFVDLDVTGAVEEVAFITQSDFSVLADTTQLDMEDVPIHVQLTVFARQGVTATAVAIPASVELTPLTE